MSNNILGNFQSLVKYSTPQLVSVATRKKNSKKQGLSSKDAERQRTEDILSEILPPKEVVSENGQLWVSTVLSTPATRMDIIQLQQELDKKLQQKQARETGICPIREQLYEQCFDELIRQITIDCHERGLLLVRVRNEFINQLEAYKNLYESSIAYGMRKMIDSEKKKTDLNTENMLLERECADLDKDVLELEQKIEYTKKQENSKLEHENEQHRLEIEKIKEQNNKLKEELQQALENSNVNGK